MDKEILIIDDDDKTSVLARELFEGLGYRISSRPRLASGLKEVRGGQIVLLNSAFSGGIACLKEIKSYYPEAVVIAMLPEDGRQDAKEAMTGGAYNYITKPLDVELFKITVESAGRHIAMKEELHRLKTALLRPPQISAKSPEMLRILKQVEKVSAKDEPVLISGEDGVGRGLIARAIHYRSPRKTAPFIAIDISKGVTDPLLAGVTDPLLAGVTDPFGREDHHPTLFIRGLEEAWGTVSIRQEALPSVRMICAVKNNPGLDWLEVKVPALRSRKEDILPIARHFIKEAGEIFETGPKKLSKEAEKMLINYTWPGNVKELKNIIRKACIVSKDGIIDRHDLLSEGIGSIKEFLEGKLKKYLKELSGVRNSNLYDTVVSEVQRSLVEIALEETNGNQLKAAKILDISRNTLRAKMTGGQ